MLVNTYSVGLWYGEQNAISNAANYAKFYSRPHDAVIRVYDEAGNVIETHEQASDFTFNRDGWSPSRNCIIIP